MLISKSLSACKDAGVPFKPALGELFDGSGVTLRFFLETLTGIFLASFFCRNPA
jgi:hypothetical protein